MFDNQSSYINLVRMKIRRITSLIAGLLVVSSIVSGQSFLKTEGPQIVNGSGEKIILRGMGLGGWMLQEGYMLRVQGIGQQQHVIRQKIEELVGKEKADQFYNLWLSNHTRKIDIDSMKAWGFNSVRLPIHYNLFTLSTEQEPMPDKNTWLEKGFALTDSLLKWCAVNQMYLILDLHAAPGGQGSDLNIADRDPSKPSLWQSEANQRKMIALWKKLAERYTNNPWIGAYDIINEPNFGFEKAEDKNGCSESSNAPLKKLMVDITSAIREVDKNHIIIIEGNCWGNNYDGIFPPWDNNTVISFHKYWNYNDQASIKKFIDIRKQYNTPVWLGESGENSNLWFRDAIHLMEKNEIGWAWWPLKKLGFNNPLEVKVPIGFQKILNYWNGQGEKPKENEAYQGLTELTTNLKLENCTFHKDVIDAMFRQTLSNETIPFKKHSIKSGAIIQAVDYDLGRNSFASFDKDTANYWVANGKHSDWNKGWMYRNDGVDIAKQNNQLYVNHFEAGEWLQYTIMSEAENKIFALSLRISNKISGKIKFELNGNTKEIIAKPNEQWHDVIIKGLSINQGRSMIRIKVAEGEINFQSIQFK
jgi:endoglucanase